MPRCQCARPSCADCLGAEIKRADYLDARAIQRVVKAKVRAPLPAIRGFVRSVGAKSILSASFAEIQRIVNF